MFFTKGIKIVKVYSLVRVSKLMNVFDHLCVLRGSVNGYSQENNVY